MQWDVLVFKVFEEISSCSTSVSWVFFAGTLWHWSLLLETKTGYSSPQPVSLWIQHKPSLFVPLSFGKVFCDNAKCVLTGTSPVKQAEAWRTDSGLSWELQDTAFLHCLAILFLFTSEQTVSKHLKKFLLTHLMCFNFLLHYQHQRPYCLSHLLLLFSGFFALQTLEVSLL